MAAIAAITITMLYFYAFTDRNQKYFSETRKASKGDNSYTVPESLKLKLKLTFLGIKLRRFLIVTAVKLFHEKKTTACQGI